MNACTFLGLTAENTTKTSLERAYERKLIQIRSYKHILDPVDYQCLEYKAWKSYRFILETLDHTPHYHNILQKYLGILWKRPSFILSNPEESSSITASVETMSVKGREKRTITTRQTCHQLHGEKPTVLREFCVDGKIVEQTKYEEAIRHQKEEFGKSIEGLFFPLWNDAP